MSFSRFLLGSAAVALIGAAAPSVAGAQGSWKTACNDGSTTNATGANACDGHGGIHKVNSTILHRAPSHTAHPSVPSRVTQAGTPAPAAKPPYEEHHGWRWKRHHEEKREERREERREEKQRRVRCRDGRYETVEGKAKGRDVCKHHGGMAH